MRATRALGGATVLATVALLCTACASSDESSASSPAVSETSTYDPRQLLVGRVTRDGEPISGVEVAGELWPDDTDDTPVGGVVDTFPLGRSTTDVDGTWALTLDVDDVPERYLVGGGRAGAAVNVDLMVLTPDGPVTWSVPMSRTAGPDVTAAWRSSNQDTVDDPPHRIDIDLATGTVRDVTSDGEVTEGTTGF